ncbi:MAG: small multi-drug export protein [Clostridia bacterium]|nr:small multi-drug export protein [Clostridia bacterium]
MQDIFTNYFNFLTRELAVFIIAMLPLAELKVAIPFGVSMGMNTYHATILGILGSMVPVPFILLLLRPVIAWFRKTRIGNKIADAITRRVMHKSKKVKKYRILGLFIFVAIPLPTTGVWTGSAIAALFNMRIRNALIAIFLGNCCAATIMMVLSHSAISSFKNWFN